ncbi:MAG: molybdopterin dinucleotide binding domain-containing protein [Planctomycetales bacterium]
MCLRHPDNLKEIVWATLPQNTVIVMSQRGRVRASAFVTPNVQPGQLFLPMHYEEVNQLTDAVFDPYSKQPSYKACAAQVLHG